MKILRKLFITFFCLMCFASANSATIPVSADSVSVKTSKILSKNVVNKSILVSINIKNKSEKAVTLIAAISPVAKRTQLRHASNLLDSKNNHPVKSIKLKPQAKQKKMVSEKFEVKLIGLKRHPRNMNLVPITLVFSDGSYLRVNSRVDRSV